MLYLDIETDGLTPTLIWLVGVAENDKPPYAVYEPAELQALVDRSDAVVAHNGIKFDFYQLERLWRIDFSQTKKVDSYILSSLASPAREGGHSLASWGNRLGFKKGHHVDWHYLSPEMIEYCIRDVEVLRRVVKQVTRELKEFSNGCADLEHDVAEILAQQERNGFLLDVSKASGLWETFTIEMNQIEAQLQQEFPPIIEERWSDKTGKRLQDKVTIFNVGSRKQIGERLTGLGVKFKSFTPTGQPVIDEGILAGIDLPEAKLIHRYLMLQKRTAQLSSWVDAADAQGRVHGRVRTIGAVTGRMTHSGPNMAQVPSVSAEEGPALRSCWTVPDGYSLVGIDASGLELRMLAHHMKDDEYTRQILEGDIHTYNQHLAGLPERRQAKTFIYAFLYGAGDAKIGQIVNGSKREGAILKERFLSGLPKLGKLLKLVHGIVDTSNDTLPGLDGRRIGVRNMHSALNTLLQGNGAIVMKEWLVIFNQMLVVGKYPAKFVVNVHDEVQLEVKSEHAHDVGQLGVDCFKKVTEVFNLRCPLDGEYVVGNNWAETH